MASKIKVDAIETTTGSGSIAINNTLSGFTSTGIDDNATSTAITIDSSENVGIGVVPGSGWNSNYTAIQIGSVGSLYGYTAAVDGADVVLGCNEYTGKYINTDQASHYVQYDGKHIFRVAPSGTADAAITWTTAMTIDNSGKIEAGDATSGKGWSVTPENNIYKHRSRAALTDMQTHWEFKNPNGIIGTIKTTGSATQFNTSSDYRLKENVVPMTGSIDRLKALNPSRFNFIADADTTVDGFLAHEAQEVVPEAISGTKDAMMTEEYEVTPAVMDGEDVVTEAVMGEREVPDMQGIDQSKLVPLLVASLQEAVARIEILEGGN